jgi:hypothetical protein
MQHRTAWAVPALVGSLLLPGVARAQYGGLPGRPQGPEETTTGRSYKIKRKTVHGTVKAVNKDKKSLTVAVDRDGGKEVPVDASGGIIRAGKGWGTVADIQPGDKIRVYGESTVQGGVRSMEMTLPPARMSIAPLTKEEKKKQEAERAAAAAAAAAQARADNPEKKDETAEKPAKKKKEKREKRPKRQKTDTPDPSDKPADPDKTAAPDPADNPGTGGPSGK